MLPQSQPARPTLLTQQGLRAVHEKRRSQDTTWVSSLWTKGRWLKIKDAQEDEGLSSATSPTHNTLFKILPIPSLWMLSQLFLTYTSHASRCFQHSLLESSCSSQQPNNTQEGNINSSSHSWHVAKEWSAFESGNKEDRGGKSEGRRDAGYERWRQLEMKYSNTNFFLPWKWNPRQWSSQNTQWHGDHLCLRESPWP